MHSVNELQIILSLLLLVHLMLESKSFTICRVSYFINMTCFLEYSHTMVIKVE